MRRRRRRSPIDIVSDITPPFIPESGRDWLRIILIIIGIILLILILLPFLPFILNILGILLKGVLWVVMLPFRVVQAIIKKCKSKKDDADE